MDRRNHPKQLSRPVIGGAIERDLRWRWMAVLLYLVRRYGVIIDLDVVGDESRDLPGPFFFPHGSRSRGYRLGEGNSGQT